jgi:beta-glucosidase
MKLGNSVHSSHSFHRRSSLFFLLSTVVVSAALARPAEAQAPAAERRWFDTTRSFEQRARDLVARMTLAEKVAQMQDVAPAIPRLGLPAYNWWNEGLHGVARSGLATVFPQAIGFAATWDDSLVHRMATVISDEARAKHHEYARHDQRGRYQGLTIWSPNINLFRDPRWGRGQETYGEDPWLTGRLAVQFIRGLQGDDPRFLKTVATVKHFAVHSGPEPERHSFDAVVSPRDLRESYLPHFETGIREGGAYSLMCAYNRVGGAAACASDTLLAGVLRREWRFPGFVVSDCGAIDDIWMRHKVLPDAATAAARSVQAGTDLECGNNSYRHLGEAVARGLVAEATIDTAVTRLVLGRMRLGMFDPPSRVRWQRIPYSVVDAPAHKALARQVARESMVLLRNERNTLPLRKDLRTLAVIGPNADQWRVMLGNYNGLPSRAVTPLAGIRAAVSPRTRVLYARGSDLADGFPVLETVPATALRTPEGRRGLRAEYRRGRDTSGAPLFSAIDSVIDADWGEASPRRDLPADSFAVRWTGTLRPIRSGTYRVGVIGSMRAQLFIDDSVVARTTYPQRNDEYPDPRLAQGEPMTLEAGRSYRIRIEATESYGEAQLELVWAPPSAGLEEDALAAARQADAVVMVLGLSPRLEGEEMPVQIPGFRGGDRATMDLPAPQQRLLEKVVALGKPTVLVLLNGSALAVNWAQANVPAILEAWYPGQAGGSAIADVLFGDYNPAGRLPVTFYRDTSDLPPFADYAMLPVAGRNVPGRTYRFFEGTTLYPFGHGLSYTTFRYDTLRTRATNRGGRHGLQPEDTVTVEVDVTNTGRRAGDEVVQLYVRHVDSKVTRPRLELRGYRRVSLKPGETRTVALALPVHSLGYWDERAGRWLFEQRESIRLMVGASSADIRRETTIQLGGLR